jgi:hypothetical protein
MNIKILSLFTLTMALAALGVSIVALRRPPEKWLPVVKPTHVDLARALFSRDGGPITSHGDRIFRNRYKDEVEKSLVVADIATSLDNTLALVFVRFNASGRAFRQAFWARNMNGEWLADYVSTYKGDSIINNNKEWIEKSGKEERGVGEHKCKRVC